MSHSARRAAPLSPAPDLAADFSARFSLKKPLRVGDNGILLAATDRAAGGRPCVVRLPHAWWLRAGGDASRWLAPWRQMHDHPLACQPRVYAVGSCGQVPWVAHEWVPGIDLVVLLKELVGAGRLLPVRFGLAATLFCAEAAVQAKAAGIVAGHGPVVGRLGPHRVRVTDYGRLVLTTGFAPAESLVGLEVPSAPAEYAYLAPEWVRSRELSPASDAWALCLMLHHATSGWNPFDRHDIAETIEAIFEASHPSVSPFLSEGVAALVATGALVDPAHRMEIGRPMVDCLRRALSFTDGVPSPQEWGALLHEPRPRLPGPSTDDEASRTAIRDALQLISTAAGPVAPPRRTTGTSRGPAPAPRARMPAAPRWGVASIAGGAAGVMLSVVLLGARTANGSLPDAPTPAGASHAAASSAGVPLPPAPGVSAAPGGEPAVIPSTVPPDSSQVDLAEGRGYVRIRVQTARRTEQPRASTYLAEREGDPETMEFLFLGVDAPPDRPIVWTRPGGLKTVTTPERVGGFALRIECDGACPPLVGNNSDPYETTLEFRVPVTPPAVVAGS